MADFKTDVESIQKIVNRAERGEDAIAAYYGMVGIDLPVDIADNVFQSVYDLKFKKEKKIAAFTPEQKFQKYKQEHPGTIKTPSDPLFKPDPADIDTASHYFDKKSDRDAWNALAGQSSVKDLPIHSTKFISHGSGFTDKHIKDMDYKNFPHSQYTDKPIMVAQVGDDYHVLDGQHRLNHHAKSGKSHIKALVVPGDFAKETLNHRKDQMGHWTPSNK